MKDYIIVDSNDYVVSSGTIQEENIARIPVPEGHRLVRGHRAIFAGRRLKFTGEKVETLDEPLFPPSVSQERARAYPPVGDQLEAIWEALSQLQGPLPEKARQVLAQIQDVKARHPKAAPGRIDRA